MSNETHGPHLLVLRLDTQVFEYLIFEFGRDWTVLGKEIQTDRSKV